MLRLYRPCRRKVHYDSSKFGNGACHGYRIVYYLINCLKPQCSVLNSFRSLWISIFL